MEDKSLRCEIVAEEEDLYIWADEEKIEMVLNNLLSNAIRYSNAGGNIKIILKATEDGKVCYIGVQNDGDAIPEDKLDKIWEKFYRLESSRNKDNGGSGLGLAIVKNILELHQADFGAWNLPEDRGVIFYFTLPTTEVEYD